MDSRTFLATYQELQTNVCSLQPDHLHETHIKATYGRKTCRLVTSHIH